MATVRYLFKKTTGEWVFGANVNSICPAGLYRLDISAEGKITMRHNFNKDIADQFASTYSDFKQENGTAYASLSAFVTATKEFFSKTGDDDDTIAAVNSVKTSVDSTKGSVDLVKNAVDLVKTAVDYVKNAVTTLQNKQFAANGYVVVSDTTPVANGSFTGFLVTGSDTVIDAITGVDTDLIEGDNDFSEITFQPGTFVEVPGGFTGITLTSGSLLLIKE